MGAPRVAQPFPFFKESESNKRCCGCGISNGRSPPPGAPSEIPQVVGINPALTNVMPSSGFIDNGHHFLKIDKSAQVEMFDKPQIIGTGQFTRSAVPHTLEWGRDRETINMDLLYRDRKS